MFACFLDIKSAFDKVSYNRLFCKLLDRGVPLFIVLLLDNWYSSQRLFAYWNGIRSDYFMMKNGIRQGSILSPKLFNLYIDDLNVVLRDTGVGCHVGGVPLNNFAYADDLVILGPTARSLNFLLSACSRFARCNYIEFNKEKSLCMLFKCKGVRLPNPPNIMLDDVVLNYTSRFKYLGHVLTEDFNDNEDIEREVRSLCVRGNLIARKFYFCSTAVKLTLFKIYCYPWYTASLWANYNLGTLSRLKVTYNDIFRRLMGVPRWTSARALFVEYRVNSFYENLRFISFGCFERVNNSSNELLLALWNSAARVFSLIFQYWQNFVGVG